MANNRKPALIIEASRTGYTLSQVRYTMTVGELIEALESVMYEYGEDVEIFPSHDRGYTYGPISEGDSRLVYYDESRIYEDEEDEW